MTISPGVQKLIQRYQLWEKELGAKETEGTIAVDEVAARVDEIETHRHAEDDTDGEEGEGRKEVEDTDPLVVGREDPAAEAGAGCEVVFGAHE